MKLKDLFTGGEVFGDPDHEVTHALPLDVKIADPDSLRFWNGLGEPIGTHLGGVIVIPVGFPLSDQATFVISEDPKASFFDAVRRLYPMGNSLRLTIPSGLRTGHNTVIGGDGFGFYKGKRVPHIGGVTIGRDVEVGSNTCIDRGTIGDTEIGDRTKIDNLVHIAHNVRIGTDCQIVAGTVIGGSAVIGNNVFVGINASIKNKVRIGDDAVIGMGAVVTKDVPAGATVVGNPARILQPKMPTHETPMCSIKNHPKE